MREEFQSVSEGNRDTGRARDVCEMGRFTLSINGRSSLPIRMRKGGDREKKEPGLGAL